VSDERDIVEMTKNGSVHELATALQAERARIQELEQQTADRDAAWERAIEAWWNKGRRASDSKDFLAAIREILEAEGGRA